MSWWVWLAIGSGCLTALWLGLVGWLYAAGRRSDARALAGFVPDCVVLVSRLLRDRRVATRRKLLLAGLVAYLVMPFDVVPDFIPVAGQIDDVILVAFVLRRFVRAGDQLLIREHWPGPVRTLDLLLRVAGA